MSPMNGTLEKKEKVEWKEMDTIVLASVKFERDWNWSIECRNNLYQLDPSYTIGTE